MHIVTFAVSMVSTLAFVGLVAAFVWGPSWTILGFVAGAAVLLQLGYFVVVSAIVERRRRLDAPVRDAELRAPPSRREPTR